MLWSIANFRSYEEAFDQHREGLVTQESFNGMVASLKFSLAPPATRVVWRMTRNAYRGGFVEFVDTLVAEMPVTETVDLLSSWKAEVAAEMERAFTVPPVDN